MTISSDDVRHLLDAEDDAVLVLVEGKTELTDTDLTGEDGDTLQVISRADLVEHLGDDAPADYEIDQVAVTLDAAVGELGV